MGYGEEEILSGLTDQSGITFAIYKWLRKEKKTPQESYSHYSKDLTSLSPRKPGPGNLSFYQMDFLCLCRCI